MEEVLFIAFILLMIMASVHNLIKSIFIYRAHNIKVSSIIKLLINLCGINYGISNAGIFLTKDSGTLSGCWVMTYLQTMANFLFSQSIVVFLVWKLRQYSQSKKTDYLAYGLLSMRSLFYVIYIVYLHPRIIIVDDQPKCVNSIDHENIFLSIVTITDLVIDACVAFRFVQYIRRNIKSSQTEQRISYKLFIWSALRISVATMQHICTLTLGQQYQHVGYIIQIGIYIVLSYLITYNVGKSDTLSDASLESGNYKGTEPSNSDDEDITLRVSNGMKADMPLKNVRDEIKMEHEYKVEKIDQDGDIGIIKEQISFYEMASMFFGNKRQSVTTVIVNN